MAPGRGETIPPACFLQGGVPGEGGVPGKPGTYGVAGIRADHAFVHPCSDTGRATPHKPGTRIDIPVDAGLAPHAFLHTFPHRAVPASPPRPACFLHGAVPGKPGTYGVWQASGLTTRSSIRIPIPARPRRTSPAPAWHTVL